MDNFALDVVGGWEHKGPDDLLPALQLALNHNGACVAFAVKQRVDTNKPETALYLYWNSAKGSTPLLTPITDAGELHELVVRWLAKQPKVDELRDSDVDEEAEGFQAWTNSWGHGGGDPDALLAVKPRTRWLGK